jgi:hypothetical protein
MPVTATSAKARSRPGVGSGEAGTEPDESFMAERLPEEFVDEVRLVNEFCDGWQEEKTEEVCASIESKTSLTLNQGAQGIVGVAVGIMATLMIGVVVLGKIDNFTLDLTGNWQNTSKNVSSDSQDTFDFLNLVPFLIVALFVLGLMSQRM